MTANFNQFSFGLKIAKTELIGFFAGIKPAILTGFDDKIDMINNIGITKRIFAKLGWRKKLYFVESPREEQQWLAISSNLKIAEELLKSFLGKDFEKTGRLLGYPECCARRYVKDLPEQATAYDISIRTRGSLSWYLNNVFNPQTRPVISDRKKDMPKLRKIENANIKEKTYPSYLISHFPCSYNCEKSIKIGKKIFGVIKKINSADALLIEKILKKPILFFDAYHWVVFNGVMKENNVLYYSSISSPKSLIAEPTLKKIKMGNKISLEGKEVVVFRGRCLIGHFIPGGFKPIILNFQP